MKPVDDKEETVTIRAVSGDEEGKKKVEKIELNTHNIETIKHVEKKLIDKGVLRKERHPADGLPFKRQPHKAGHGGKFTWEGSTAEIESQIDHLDPVAMDKGDPNYVDEEEGSTREVEVAKVAPQGVARVELDPRLNV